jgi:hypothetical protein
MGTTSGDGVLIDRYDCATTFGCDQRALLTRDDQATDRPSLVSTCSACDPRSLWVPALVGPTQHPGLGLHFSQCIHDRGLAGTYFAFHMPSRRMVIGRGLPRTVRRLLD